MQFHVKNIAQFIVVILGLLSPCLGLVQIYEIEMPPEINKQSGISKSNKSVFEKIYNYNFPQSAQAQLIKCGYLKDKSKNNLGQIPSTAFKLQHTSFGEKQIFEIANQRNTSTTTQLKHKTPYYMVQNSPNQAASWSFVIKNQKIWVKHKQGEEKKMFDFFPLLVEYFKVKYPDRDLRFEYPEVFNHLTTIAACLDSQGMLPKEVDQLLLLATMQQQDNLLNPFSANTVLSLKTQASGFFLTVVDPRTEKLDLRIMIVRFQTAFFDYLIQVPQNL